MPPMQIIKKEKKNVALSARVYTHMFVSDYTPSLSKFKYATVASCLNGREGLKILWNDSRTYTAKNL